MGLRIAGFVLLASLLPAADLAIQPVANSGMFLRCGSDKVLVDALYREGVAGYERVPPALLEKMELAAPPFDGKVLILATHRHADHFAPASVLRHLRSNPQARFLGTPQTAGPLAAAGAQVETVAFGAARTVGGITVRFLRAPHNQPHRDSIENSVLLVGLCGQTVLFSGDAEPSADDFRPLGLERERIDVAVLPFWFYTGRGGREVVDTVIRPGTAWAAHADTRNPEQWIRQVRANYPEARISLQGRR